MDDTALRRTGSACVRVLHQGCGAVTDVVFSHHHPDHTVNAALFPAARIHDLRAQDPFAPDAAVLAASRARILALASVINPGHGPAFRPDARTPR